MPESLHTPEQNSNQLAKKFGRFLTNEISTSDTSLSATIEIESFDDTFIIENEDFLFSFTFDDDVFAILSVEITNKGVGHGPLLLEIVHEFANKYNLSVEARKVEDEAIGFWESLGYEEGTEPGTYHYNG